jgi:signal transduction histidine kinase
MNDAKTLHAQVAGDRSARKNPHGTDGRARGSAWPSPIAILALCDAAWLTLAGARGFPGGWAEPGILLAGATALAGIAHAMRMRSLRRIKSARIRNLRGRHDELKALKARLEGEVERLKQVNALQAQFINMASHELRTPLTPILLQVGLLGNPEAVRDQARWQRSLDIIRRNLERLNRLMGDVLDSSRIQANRLRVNRRTVDVERLVLDAVESFQGMAKDKGLNLETDLEADAWVLADPDRIHQVLVNLLYNAMKFTPSGGTVHVEARRSGSHALVRVRDNGLGIRPEDKAKLFQPFSQIHDPVGPIPPGSGLGLHISRGVVETHGGAIWCESDGPGKGSSFAFTLPLEPFPPSGEAEGRSGDGLAVPAAAGGHGRLPAGSGDRP